MDYFQQAFSDNLTRQKMLSDYEQQRLASQSSFQQPYYEPKSRDTIIQIPEPVQEIAPMMPSAPVFNISMPEQQPQSQEEQYIPPVPSNSEPHFPSVLDPGYISNQQQHSVLNPDWNPGTNTFGNTGGGFSQMTFNPGNYW